MKISDQDLLQIHDNLTASDLYGISNNDGVFAYFTDESVCNKFANLILNTSIRVDLLLESIELSTEDETSYNELEVIQSELSFLRSLLK